MANSLNGMAEHYREMLADPTYIELLGVHDVLSALIGEATGFKAVFASGYGIAASLFGNPDIGLTTLTETALASKNMITRLPKTPVIVDVDNGYGNEDNVIRTIREMEFSGAAGVIMEDQVLPKRCGHTANKMILNLPFYMKKLEYAMKARETPLVITARTDAADLDEAIMRAKTFHSAGADLTLIDGVKTLDALKRIGAEVPGHKQVNLIYGGLTPPLSAVELNKIGFKVILYSTPTLFVAARALWEWLPRLRETHDLKAIAEGSVDFKNFQKFIEDIYVSRMRDQGFDTPQRREATGKFVTIIDKR